MLEIFIPSFVSLFVIVDPLGTSGVFSALTHKLNAATQKSIAYKAFTIATILLFLFGIGGQFLLVNMGISLDAFRIAGGLLLFVTAFRMIMGFHDSDSINSSDSCYKDTSNLAIFPIAIPLLAGPGCMTAMILNMNEVVSIENKIIVVISMVLVQIIALMTMLTAGKITQILGPAGASLLSRLMGVLLAAMSVQFIADGVVSIFS